MLIKCIPLTNRVRGPYCKLRSFFPFNLWPKREWRAGHKSKGKKQGSITYSTDQENEVSKIFIISLACVTDLGKISIHAERLQISDARQKQIKRVNLKLFLSHLARFCSKHFAQAASEQVSSQFTMNLVNLSL